MTRLALAFLGPPEVKHDDVALSFATRKALALLIFLSVEGGMQPREKLATLFWPESSHKSGRASLRTTLALLRKELAHDGDAEPLPHLRVERTAIGFNDEADYELDVEVVQRAFDRQREEEQLPLAALQTAVSLVRGDFLESFSLPDAPRFDDWVGYQQEQWHVRSGQLFDRLAQRQTERGNATRAIATLNRWLALNPFEERAYRRLMRAYLALGDRPGALQVYEKCASTLNEELDVDPAPETAAIAERIRSSRGQTSSMQTAVAPDRPSTGETPRLTMPLVGRSEEHGQLAEAYHRARRGRFRAVAILGEAGIGKTSLAHHFLNWAAAQGATKLRGRAFESGGRLPYQPIVDALRPLWHGDGELPSLSPTWLGELSRLFPEMRDLYADLPPPTRDEATAQSRLFEAVAQLGQTLCRERPLVLFVDDVQWADAATLDLLHVVAHRWLDLGAPIVLLLGVRSEALARAGGELADWLANLSRELPLERLELAPLEEPDVEQLAAALGVPSGQAGPLAQRLFAETSGQPFYLAETIKALIDEGVLRWREDGAGATPGARRLEIVAGAADEAFRLEPGFVPPGVRDVLLGRLARLSPAAFRLLAAAAVLGQAFSYRQLCHVSAVDPDEGLAALDELLATHLLVEAEAGDRRPYLFAHDKIRDVVYTEAGDARRRLFHKRAHALLSETGAPAAQMAHHAVAAGLAGPAFTQTLAAGDAAMDLFAVRDAVDQYERARSVLHEHPRLREQVEAEELHHLYRRLGRGYELLDEWDTAQEVEKEMLDLAGELDLPRMQVTALNRLASVALQSRLDVDEAGRLLERATSLAEANEDDEGLAEAEWNLAQTEFFRLDWAAAIDHGERALQLANSLQRPQLIARSHNILSYAKGRTAPTSRLAEAADHATAGRDLYQELGNRAMVVDCMNMLGSIAIHGGRPTEAVELLRRARRASLEIDNVWGQANTAFNLAQALLETGRYGEALAMAEKGVNAAEAGGATPLLGATLSVRGDVYRALRALDAALDNHLAAERIAASTSNPCITHVLALDLCADYALMGEWKKAQAYAGQALEQEMIGAWLFSGFQIWLLTAALLRGGDAVQARQTTQHFAGRVGDNPRYQIPCRRSLALLAEHDDDLAGAAAHLEAALAQAREITLPGEEGSLLADLADVKERQGEEERATALRHQAHETVELITGQIEDADLRKRFFEQTAGRGLRSRP